MIPSKPSTPKLDAGAKTNRDAWYRYYAGFSAAFVRDVVSSIGLSSDQRLADPWNGSGTTTAVAEELGFSSWGGDVNPAMAVIAKARLLGSHVTPSELSLCESVILNADFAIFEDDPFLVWFTLETGRSLRGLERSIARLLDPYADSQGNQATEVSTLSALACFFYLALFRTVRDLLAPFRSSNPTWIKQPSPSQLKLALPACTIHDSFRSHVTWMASQSFRSSSANDGHSPQQLEHGLTCPSLKAQIQVASSTSLPLADQSVAAVVSSPPYCTRIDYAVATAPELAVLGIGGVQLRTLREAMIGSSTVRKDEPEVDLTWGPTCVALIESVATHRSKASATYYLRNHLQYFDGLVRSLREIDRVLQPGATCVLVVQDSHYKEVHNDLPTIVSEMGQAQGWMPLHKHDYISARHMGRVHPGSRVYRKSSDATESVLVFQTTS